jgi:hypothetical protein
MFALGRYPISNELSKYIKQQTNKFVEKNIVNPHLATNETLDVSTQYNSSTFVLFTILSFFLGYNFCLIKNAYLIKN